MRVSWLLYKIHTVHTVQYFRYITMSVVEQKLRYLLTLQLRDESTLFTNYKRFYLIKTNSLWLFFGFLPALSE